MAVAVQAVPPRSCQSHVVKPAPSLAPDRGLLVRGGRGPRRSVQSSLIVIRSLAVPGLLGDVPSNTPRPAGASSPARSCGPPRPGQGHTLECRKIDFGVDRGGIEAAMAQHVSDSFERGTMLEQLGGHAV